MLFSVHIEHLDDDAVQVGSAIVRLFPSQKDAMAFTQSAIHLAQPFQLLMRLRLHHPDGRLLMSYNTQTTTAVREAVDGDTVEARL